MFQKLLQYKTKNQNLFYISLVLFIFFILHILGLYFTKFEKTITIADKFVKPGNKKSNYTVIDNNDNTYTITDNILLWEFNSGDDYAEMKIGKTYKVYGYWFRYPMFGFFPKIYKYEVV